MATNLKNLLRRRYNTFTHLLVIYGAYEENFNNKSFVEYYSYVAKIAFIHKLVLTRLKKDEKYVMNILEQDFVYDKSNSESRVKRILRHVGKESGEKIVFNP